MLGILYSLGIGRPVDLGLSNLYLTMSGTITSKLALGYRHLKGIGFHPSTEDALPYYFSVATDVCEKEKSFILPLVFKERVEEFDNEVFEAEDVITYYEINAQQGDIDSLVLLGSVYAQGGNGIPRDYHKSFQYLKQAAHSGSYQAMGLLGNMFWKGKGVEKDVQMALHYFREGSLHKDPVSLNGIGVMHHTGSGLKKDEKLALKYFQMAADLEYTEAYYNLAMLFKEISPGLGFTKSLHYFREAGKKGHLLSYYELAKIYLLAGNNENALTYFKAVAERSDFGLVLDEAFRRFEGNESNGALIQYLVAAEYGFETAQWNSAMLLKHSGQEGSRSVVQLLRSAQQGNSFSYVLLGDIFYYGNESVKQNFYSAVLFYQLAEQDDDPRAMYNLGYMHEHGQGLVKDEYLAKRYYIKCFMNDKDMRFPIAAILFKIELIQTWRHLRSTFDKQIIALLAALVLSLIVYFRNSR